MPKNKKESIIITNDNDTGVSIWKTGDLIMIMKDGVVIPFTIEQFKIFSEQISSTYLYITGKNASTD